MKRRVRLLLVTTLGVLGCAKPKPPSLEPVSAQATSASKSRLEVTVRLKAKNPNSSPLVMSQVTADCQAPSGKLVASGSNDMALTVPANASSLIEFKLDLPLKPIAPREPYYWRPTHGHQAVLMRGTARFGDASSGIEVPFVVSDVLGVENLVNLNPSIGGIK